MSLAALASCHLVAGLDKRQRGDEGGGVATSAAAGAGGAGQGASSTGTGPMKCNGPGDCDDLNPCTTDSCGGDKLCAYAFVNDGTACDDGKFCNGVDTCSKGVCIHPGNPCNVVADCDDARKWCRCDDGNVCTKDDHLMGAMCVATNDDNLLCQGSKCDSANCRRCCGGLCIDLTMKDRCGNCDNKCNSPPTPNNCVWAGGPTPCGWPWCCEH